MKDRLYFNLSSGVQNPRHLRRDRLAVDIEKLLYGPGCRFVLWAAEPGACKSTLMVQLARHHPGRLRYFIRCDQRSALGDHPEQGIVILADALDTAV